jgi:hypothetical protein
MAVLVDTALLYALLLLPDSGALLKFFERPNCVDFAAGEAALQRAGRYAELVALYRVSGRQVSAFFFRSAIREILYSRYSPAICCSQSRDRHESALDMLQTLSASPEELPSPPQGAAVELKGMPGVWAAVKYLTSMDSPDFQLVSAHSKWILQGDPEAGLEMFEQMQPPLAASVVLPILTSYMPDVAGARAPGALCSILRTSADHPRRPTCRNLLGECTRERGSRTRNLRAGAGYAASAEAHVPWAS